jgi:hypothetical protein
MKLLELERSLSCQRWMLYGLFPTKDNTPSPELEERVRLEFAHQLWDEGHHEMLQVRVAQVSRRDQQEFRGPAEHACESTKSASLI